MKIFFAHQSRAVLTGIIALIMLSACSGAPEEQLVPVTLNGTIKMVAGPVPAGTISMRLYVLETSQEGELQHPLAEIEDFQSDTTEFTHSFQYPAHIGSGLALHAWVDTDGDGIFCTPTDRLDPSGLAWIEASPEGEISLTVTLTENCRAAGWLYPPAP
jgi:hypothetical protein